MVSAAVMVGKCLKAEARQAETPQIHAAESPIALGKTSQCWARGHKSSHSLLVLGPRILLCVSKARSFVSGNGVTWS